MNAEEIPNVMLDAGGEPWHRLHLLVGRRMDEMPYGGVLELVSQHTGIRRPLRAWCGVAGHELITTTLDGRRTAFRITKRRAVIQEREAEA